MLLLIVSIALWLALLVLAAALVRLGSSADMLSERSFEHELAEEAVSRLAAVRSASGKPFIPSAAARRALSETLADAYHSLVPLAR
jgi:biopolymer transport protein ExbB/TolQ